MFNDFRAIKSYFDKISFIGGQDENEKKGRLLIGFSLAGTEILNLDKNSIIIAKSEVIIYGTESDLDKKYFTEADEPIFDNIRKDNAFKFEFRGEVVSKIILETTDCKEELSDKENTLLALIVSSLEPQIQMIFGTTKYQHVSLPII